MRRSAKINHFSFSVQHKIVPVLSQFAQRKPPLFLQSFHNPNYLYINGTRRKSRICRAGIVNDLFDDACMARDMNSTKQSQDLQLLHFIWTSWKGKSYDTKDNYEFPRICSTFSFYNTYFLLSLNILWFFWCQALDYS